MRKRLLLGFLIISILIPQLADAGGTFSRVKTWSTGETLTASDLNAEFDNIITYMTPAGVDDASADAAAMQATTDPYPAASPSLATSLLGEIQRLRYLVAQITGETYWYIDPDVTLAALNVRAPAYETIWVPAGSMIPNTTNGPAAGTSETATNDHMQDYLSFDTATEEFAGFNLVMPENWDRGTIKAKFYWLPSSNSGDPGDTVEWEIAAVAMSDDDALDAALGTPQVISDAVLTGESADVHISGATPALTVGGTPALGDMIYFRVSRNVGGTDDFGYDAVLLGVLIQYQVSNTVSAW